jgi:hypothetical protein
MMMQTICKARYAWLACCLLVSMPSFACTQTPLLWPERQKTINTAQPVLRWAQANAQPYRLQISLQTPEQSIYFSSDVQVSGGQWQLPPVVASVHSVGKVIVSQGCDSTTTSDLAASAPAFFIDLRSQCSVAPGSLKHDGERFAWQSSPGAAQFKLRVYQSAELAAESSRLVFNTEVSTASWPIPQNFCQDQIRKTLTVQPICGAIAGRALAAPVCP